MNSALQLIFVLALLSQFYFTHACQDALKSCKEIRDVGASTGDGEYWIDPANNGTHLTVFCDMKTDGENKLLPLGRK
ncbi:hypothetical protein P5673_016983 [Acropora cervicornis]|uniref:Fibrinogen C-terminal domain-containing protein n=1 Tax=Acropora cervicornis TaxID=6130 RepID=A0AAD9QEW3_ACRCE|nr:hypothetical protein P5673_016983 [Acropora cervicornis]